MTPEFINSSVSVYVNRYLAAIIAVNNVLIVAWSEDEKSIKSSLNKIRKQVTEISGSLIATIESRFKEQMADISAEAIEDAKLKAKRANLDLKTDDLELKKVSSNVALEVLDKLVNQINSERKRASQRHRKGLLMLSRLSDKVGSLNALQEVRKQISDSQGSIFIDRAGKKWLGERFVQLTIKDGLFKVWNETIVSVALENDIELIDLVDITGKQKPITFSLKSPNNKTFEELAKILHPGTNRIAKLNLV